MSVFRLKPLPISPATGLLVVSDLVVRRTQIALRAFGDERGQRHEGLVFWAGRTIGANTYVLAAIVPKCDHGPYRVIADQQQMGAVARAARERGLGIVSEVHTHPGNDTRHSDGDDELVFMPFEGMFSLVIGNYGEGSFEPSEGAGFHQYQSGEWIQVSNGADVFRIVPALIEMENV